jgi:hypothetical protein
VVSRVTTEADSPAADPKNSSRAGTKSPELIPWRILFESRGQFLVLSDATSRRAIDGRDCLRFGGSGSDLAEEPVVRVQSRSRRL